MTGRTRRTWVAMLIASASLTLATGIAIDGQAIKERRQGVPADTSGYDLTLVDVDGARTLVGRLPASVYAPRISPDGKRIAFETRDPLGADGGRLRVAELSDATTR